MDQQSRAVRRVLLGGGLDVLLAVILAVLSLALGLRAGETWPLWLDAAMCLAAACTVRWPKTAGVALGLLLVGYFFVPRGSVSLGEYAPLIPILGTGMRDLRSVRRWMTVGYGAILVALQYRDYPGNPLFLFGALVWAGLIAVLWLIGNAFAAFRQAQAEAHAAALVQQRVFLARDLHDTVARDLSRASLRAQHAQQHLDPAEMGMVVEEIQSALAQLRWTMNLLRDPRPDAWGGQDEGAGSPSQALRDAALNLESRGFAVALTIEGDPERIPPTLWPTIKAMVEEASSNIERHASTSHPCALILDVDHEAADMVFINQVEDRDGPRTGSGDSAMGLLGVRERLTPIGGELQTLQEGTQWMTRIRIPLPAPDKPG